MLLFYRSKEIWFTSWEKLIHASFFLPGRNDRGQARSLVVGNCQMDTAAEHSMLLLTILLLLLLLVWVSPPQDPATLMKNMLPFAPLRGPHAPLLLYGEIVATGRLTAHGYHVAGDAHAQAQARCCFLAKPPYGRCCCCCLGELKLLSVARCAVVVIVEVWWFSL